MTDTREMVEFGEAEGLAVSANGLSLCVYLDDEKFWIPYKHISDRSEVKGPKQFGTLVITKQIAVKLTLIRERHDRRRRQG